MSTSLDTPLPVPPPSPTLLPVSPTQTPPASPLKLSPPPSLFEEIETQSSHSESTISAEESLSCPGSTTNSYQQLPSPTPSIDSLLENSTNSGIPSYLEDFLLGSPIDQPESPPPQLLKTSSKPAPLLPRPNNSELPPSLDSLLETSAEEPESLSSNFKEAVSEKATHNSLCPHTTEFSESVELDPAPTPDPIPTNTSQSAQLCSFFQEPTPDPTPLPVLSAKEVEAELQLLPSQNPYSPPRAVAIQHLQYIPPSIFDIQVFPTESLIQLLQHKKKQTHRFRKNYCRKISRR